MYLPGRRDDIVAFWHLELLGVQLPLRCNGRFLASAPDTFRIPSVERHWYPFLPYLFRYCEIFLLRGPATGGICQFHVTRHRFGGSLPDVSMGTGLDDQTECQASDCDVPDSHCTHVGIQGAGEGSVWYQYLWLPCAESVDLWSIVGRCRTGQEYSKSETKKIRIARLYLPRSPFEAHATDGWEGMECGWEYRGSNWYWRYWGCVGEPDLR